MQSLFMRSHNMLSKLVSVRERHQATFFRLKGTLVLKSVLGVLRVDVSLQVVFPLEAIVALRTLERPFVLVD